MSKPSYKVIGVMSGTSLDGIDIVYVTYKFDSTWKSKIDFAKTVNYSEYWLSVLRDLINKPLEELHLIDKDYSKYLGEVVLEFVIKNKVDEVDFISSHGHTALHQPERGITYQIGNHQVLADSLKTKVICDFRVQDLEYGGQGAPLVPIGDRLLFGNYDFCLNLGGFANVSYEDTDIRIAYDICPVNIIMNHYMSNLGLEFDDKGSMASSGTINQNLLSELNGLEFYNQLPPKSLGLEWVKEEIFPLIDSYKLKTKDILRTVVEHIATQVSKVLSIEKTTVLVTGGGTYNDFLMDRIRLLSKSIIVIPDKQTIEFKEALVFGLLGVLKERNEINCLKSVTGASKDHSSGKILIPKS